MIIYTTLIYNRMNFVLFDLSSTFSYVFVKFALWWDLECEFLNTFMYVSTLVGVSLCVDQMYHAYSV